MIFMFKVKLNHIPVKIRLFYLMGKRWTNKMQQFYFLFVIIFYWFCCYSCHNFSLLSPSTQPPAPQAIPHHSSCPWVICVSSLATPFPILYFTSPGYSVTTYLYFLIPSPPHPFLYIPLPSAHHQNVLHIHDSVSVLLLFLVCFLDSLVDRYVFIEILFFVVLILFS